MLCPEKKYSIMRLSVERKPVKVVPDPKRVIARFFYNGEERALELIRKILALDKEATFGLVSPLLQDFSKRHRNITRKLLRHCERVKQDIIKAGGELDKMDEYSENSMQIWAVR